MILAYYLVLPDREGELNEDAMLEVMRNWRKCEYIGYVETYLGHYDKKEAFYADVLAMAMRGTLSEQKVRMMPRQFCEALDDLCKLGIIREAVIPKEELLKKRLRWKCGKKYCQN